jgi:hypothetical protein
MSSSLLLLCLLYLHPHAHAQFPEKPTFRPVRSDLPFIKCAVCRKLVAHLSREVAALRAARSYMVAEAEVDALVEGACDAKASGGAWLRHLDIQESKDGRRLLLQPRKRLGKCTTECETVQLGCRNVVEEIGMDITEALWQEGKADAPMARTRLKALTKHLCEVGSGRQFCTGKKPKRVPQSRKPGGRNFEPLDDEAVKMEQLMADMREATPGLGLSMYSKEDIARMAALSPEESQDEFEKQTGVPYSEINPKNEL